MLTGVPGGASRASRSSAASGTRTQPALSVVERAAGG